MRLKPGQLVQLRVAEYLADRDVHQAGLPPALRLAFQEKEMEYRKLLRTNPILIVSGTACAGMDVEVAFPNGFKQWVDAKFLTKLQGVPA